MSATREQPANLRLNTQTLDGQRYWQLMERIQQQILSSTYLPKSPNSPPALTANIERQNSHPPVVFPDINIKSPTVQQEIKSDIDRVAQSLGLPESTISQATQITSRKITERLKKLLTSKSQKVFTALSLLMLLTGLTFARDIKEAVFAGASVFKQDVKTTLNLAFERTGDSTCITYAKYLEDKLFENGDLAVLTEIPGITLRYLDAKTGNPRSCRDLLPENFITIAEDITSAPTSPPPEKVIESTENTKPESPQTEEYEEKFMRLAEVLSTEQINLFNRIDSSQSAIEFFSTITFHQLEKEVTLNPSTGIETISFRLPKTIRGNKFLEIIIGMTEKTYLGEGLPDHTIAVLYRFPEDTKGYLGPAVYVGGVDYSKKYFNIDAQTSLAVSTETSGDIASTMLAHFYLEDWLDPLHDSEPFKVGNRIFGMEGSAFSSGEISTHASYLCSDRKTGNWWITDWSNVPKNNPNVDAVQLMWNWYNSDDEFEIDQAFLAAQQLAELNKTIEAAESGKTRNLVGPSVAFRTSDRLNTSTDLIFFAPYFYLSNPELLKAIFEETPLTNGNKPVSLQVGSPDLHYTTNGRFPFLNRTIQLSQYPEIHSVPDSDRQSVLSNYRNQRNSVGFTLVIRK